MRKIDDANFVRVGLFHHGGGNRVPIEGVKYLRCPCLSLDGVGEKSNSVGCESYLLFNGSGRNSVVDDEGDRQRR